MKLKEILDLIRENIRKRRKELVTTKGKYKELLEHDLRDLEYIEAKITGMLASPLYIKPGKPEILKSRYHK